jgi:hypothetical protein
VVGRELRTVCPYGEDHQEHIWGDKQGNEGVRGWIRIGGSRRLIMKQKVN